MAGDYCERFSEEWELIDVLYLAAVAANFESNTGLVAVGNYHRLAIVIDPVSLSDDLDIDIEQATSATGTPKTVDSGSKDVTVLTTDTLPNVIEIQAEELDVTNRYCYLNVEATTANTGGQGSYGAIKIYGLPRYQPAATTNWDAVTD